MIDLISWLKAELQFKLYRPNYKGTYKPYQNDKNDQDSGKQKQYFCFAKFNCFQDDQSIHNIESHVCYLFHIQKLINYLFIYFWYSTGCTYTNRI